MSARYLEYCLHGHFQALVDILGADMYHASFKLGNDVVTRRGQARTRR